MKRLGIAAIMLGLMMLSCGEVEHRNSVQGRIIGADGKVPPLAHVHLIALGDELSSTIESVPVGEDGSFQVVTPDERYYDLLVTAVNHRSLLIPLVSDEVIDLRGIEIRPAPYKYRDPLDDIRVVGDWSGFSRREAEPMTLQDDGTFLYERRAEADTIAYQLLNAETSGRTINGTDSDYYIYDGGGDYISVLTVDGEMARVAFDPEMARVRSSKDRPDIDFDDRGGQVAEAWSIQKRWLAETGRMDLAFSDYVDEYGAYDGFEYDLSPIKEYLLTTMAGDMGPAARKYAAVKLAGLWEMGGTLTDDEVVALEKLLPVTDRMWMAEPMGFLEAFRQVPGPDEMVDLFESNLDKVLEKKVRAAMLLEIGLGAKEAGDTARQREIYDDLVQNYSEIGLPYLSYRIGSELNPDLRIAKGKAVPEFELDLLDNQGVVSRSSMLGKYYLMDFWATWCGPCVGEMPHLHSVYEKYKDYHFEILSISFDQSVDDIGLFRADKWKMPWRHSFLEGAFSAGMAVEFEVSGIPKPILVDPQGTIVAVGLELRGEQLGEAVGKQLVSRLPIP